MKIIRTGGRHIWDSIELRYKKRQFARSEMNRLILKNLKSIISDEIGNELLCRIIMDLPNPDIDIRNKLICYIICNITSSYPVRLPQYYINKMMTEDDYPWNTYIYRSLAEFQINPHGNISFVQFLKRKNEQILLEILHSKSVNLARGVIERRGSGAFRALEHIYLEKHLPDHTH